MKVILHHRALRLVFLANLVSMFGSGMNTAAVNWYVLQRTHSESALGVLVFVCTIPALLLLPFSGVIIDREDRRHLVMWLDAGRGLVILAVALTAWFAPSHLALWHVYLMNMLVTAGFWMFWPSINALIQELSDNQEYVQANTFLMAGVQGGWLIAGAVVGFLYNHIGIGGILLIDVATYVLSFTCYLFVRSGKHVVVRPEMSAAAQAAWEEGPVTHFIHDLREGIAYLKKSRYLQLIGVSWAIFLSALLSNMVVSAPLADRILHSGANGYGWLNAGWGIGAFLSTIFTAAMIRAMSARRTFAVALLALAIGFVCSPFSHFVAVAVVTYGMMGFARGFGGVALMSDVMSIVPKHFMGRIQNFFHFAGTSMQLVLSLVVGFIAHDFSLTASFILLGVMFLLGFITASWPIAHPNRPIEAPVEQTVPQS